MNQAVCDILWVTGVPVKNGNGYPVTPNELGGTIPSPNGTAETTVTPNKLGGTPIPDFNRGGTPVTPNETNGTIPSPGGIYVEPNVNGLNHNWVESGDFRYLLATDKQQYREGEGATITFRKRNLSNESKVLRYPTGQLFDFYISDASGMEIWRWSKTVDYGNMSKEIVLAPGDAESIELYWGQKTNYGEWVPPQLLTLWGVNTATNVSIPLQFRIY